LPRLFLSHSSSDNVAAKAFKQWLGANGWPEEDVFLDLDDINPGERWKVALRDANSLCEAIILLASPEALASTECLAEIRKAEDYGKDIIVVLLRDVAVDDKRLSSYRDRQIVDLSASPKDHIEDVGHHGTQHRVQFNSQALAKIKDQLIKSGITPDYFAWPPPGKQDADPFPGLSHFTEEDAGIFFGRDADILRGLDRLRVTRRDGRPRTFVIQAASGAGKSSYLRAGLWPRLERNPDFVAVAIARPAKGAITGPSGLGHKLAGWLSRPERPVTAGAVHAQLMADDPVDAVRHFKAMMSEITTRAHEVRRVGDNEARAPALILAIDQAEELFAPEDAEESARLVLLLAELLQRPPEGVEPFAMFAIRADSATELFKMLVERGLEPPQTLPLLPLPRTSFRDVILKPLGLLARRGQALTIKPSLVERLVEESTGVDALPLLAFTLSSLYRDFGNAGVIGTDEYDTVGGVGGAIKLALKRALARPGDSPAIPADPQAQRDCLRATFIPWLARISPETGQPMRRVALRSKFTGERLALVERLISARLLVADQREGADVVEIAHESLLRQWPDLTEWLKADGENLKVVEGVERAAGEWVRSGKPQDRLEHQSSRLRTAEALVATRDDFRALAGEQGVEYLQACRMAEQRRNLTFGSVVAGLIVLIGLGGLAWAYEPALRQALYWLNNVRPMVLTAAQEGELEPLGAFQECLDCPQMVVLPSGMFQMGGLGEGDSLKREYPTHEVTIGAEFAVARTPVTFAQYDACVQHGDCVAVGDQNTHDGRPAVNVTWDDAQRYAAWLSRITGRPYRLLSEAEYEYAARGGTATRFPWGPVVSAGQANCGDCEPRLATPMTTPVGAFPANGFGLHDVVGNVFQWVSDCFHDTYDAAPTDGSSWDTPGCQRRVVRGASYFTKASLLRASWRDWRTAVDRDDQVGFRIARSMANADETP
jgi:formylglycine-generating enzyme required for sulfatase activity